MTTAFFNTSRAFTVRDVCVLTGATLANEAAQGVPVMGLTAVSGTQPGFLIFIDGKKHARNLGDLNGVIVLCSEAVVPLLPAETIVLVHPQPQRAFAQVGREIYPEAARPVGVTGETGISARAFVDASAQIEAGSTIEAGAVVGPGAEIGAGAIISANAVIGPKCRIGRNTYIGPNASVRYALIGDYVSVHAGAVIGKDGFGFVFGPKGPERMPQLGRVILQDHVEIGANTTIDRGALGDTVIGEHTKIDNQVQIGHNVKIGRSCMIAGKCGISGSVTLGDYVLLGGGVGLADHISIGTGAQVAAGSGLMEDVPAGERWAGLPATPVRDHFRQISILRKLSSQKVGKANE